MKGELLNIILQLSEQQAEVVLKAFMISQADPGKSAKDCVALAMKELSPATDPMRNF